MGQYYTVVNVDRGEKMHSNGGNKLMEHSYIGNGLLNRVERLLEPGGDWHKTRLVWAGDYGKPAEENSVIPFEDIIKVRLRLELSSFDGNLYDMAREFFSELDLTADTPSSHAYIVNHTKKEYVDRNRVEKDADGFEIHPLPLLVSSGNGQGGGDFHGNGEALCGTWMGDVISMESTVPEGFSELIPAFKERY